MSDRLGKIDQFESVFKAADKKRFRLREILIRRVLYVDDGEDEFHDSSTLKQRIRDFVPDPPGGGSIDWIELGQSDFPTFEDLADRVESKSPDLIVARRHLFDPVRHATHSLGFFVDEVTQSLRPPVLLLPDDVEVNLPKRPRHILVLTDHLTGEDRLVSKGAYFTPDGGRLVLCHLEEKRVFDRYMHAIERIPEINTDTARETIQRQLLNEPRDYIASCIEAIERSGREIEMVSHVGFGSRAADVQRLADAHDVDLIIFYTKDESQIAMHGNAYSIAVEIRDRTLLML